MQTPLYCISEFIFTDPCTILLNPFILMHAFKEPSSHEIFPQHPSDYKFYTHISSEILKGLLLNWYNICLRTENGTECGYPGFPTLWQMALDFCSASSFANVYKNRIHFIMLLSWLLELMQYESFGTITGKSFRIIH